jgi:radical SAM protein with 4Fe4S-binding SPASM domain
MGNKQMKAKYKPRLNTEHRVKLETVIPLSTPYLIYLDPSDLCNFKCPWCPTGDRKLVDTYRKSQLMDWELYKKIIDDLCTMPEPIKTLRLYKNGEPLLNPRIADMVAYAKTSGRFGQIDTTTNSSLLTQRLSDSLIGVGLNKIFISVPRNYDSPYRWRIRYFYEASRGKCKVSLKLISEEDMSDREKQMFLDDFGDISDQIFIENLAECWPEYAIPEVNKTVGLFGQELEDIKVCSYIFYGLVINSNGTVSLCCQDWKHHLIVGDLKKERFADIWNGEKLKAYQILHLEGKRDEMPMCASCGQLRYGKPDNIDGAREKLLEKFTYPIYPVRCDCGYIGMRDDCKQGECPNCGKRVMREKL